MFRKSWFTPGQYVDLAILSENGLNVPKECDRGPTSWLIVMGCPFQEEGASSCLRLRK